MLDGISGASSHREDKRTKVVRILARSLMYPFMLHPETGNPSPITLEDMSDQEGVGSASNPEATLTHPSARDRRERPS